jgi:hypothetical protein
MSLFGSMSLIQRSFTPGHREKGSWVEGQAFDIPFMGTAQPASGRVVAQLPEGKRNSETITVFAPKEMAFTPVDPESQRSGDIIVWKGRQYEVWSVKEWDAGLIPHWELTAIRCKEGAT